MASRSASRDEVIAQIQAAFADTARPAMAEFAHCAQCELWLERFLPSCPERWDRISSENIEYEYAALTACTPAAWRFLLPAYITWHLRHHADSSSNTVDHLIYQLTRSDRTDPHILAGYESLSPAQTHAVAAFLSFVAGETDDEFLACDAAEALSSYWQARVRWQRIPC